MDVINSHATDLREAKDALVKTSDSLQVTLKLVSDTLVKATAASIAELQRPQLQDDIFQSQRPGTRPGTAGTLVQPQRPGTRPGTAGNLLPTPTGAGNNGRTAVFTPRPALKQSSQKRTAWLTADEPKSPKPPELCSFVRPETAEMVRLNVDSYDECPLKRGGKMAASNLDSYDEFPLKCGGKGGGDSDSDSCGSSMFLDGDWRRQSAVSAPLEQDTDFEVLRAWTEGSLQRLMPNLDRNGRTFAVVRSSTSMSEALQAQLPYHKQQTTNSAGAKDQLTDSTAPEPMSGFAHYADAALNCLAQHVQHPQTSMRSWWDMASIAIIIWDMVVLPLQVFDPPANVFVDFMSWVTRIFWTFDVPLSCITGYIHDNGEVEMDPKQILLRYASSWLVFDLALVIFEWSEIFWRGVLVDTGALAGRTTKIFRLIRLLRVLRMRQAMVSFVERIRSENVVLLAEILKIMLVIVGIAHLVACLWYWIGTREGEAMSWVKTDGWDQEALHYRYATCLHWSLSQLTGGMDEIHPKNAPERVFAIVVFLIAFIAAAVFISNITSSLTRLDIIKSRRATQVSILRRYLAQHGISQRLMQRIQRNAFHALSEREKYKPEAEVDLICLLSETLRVEIHFEMYAPMFSGHDFFAAYCEECPHVMRHVCHRAISTQVLTKGDLLFCAGELPPDPKMYVVRAGTLLYTSIHGDQKFLGTGQVVAEPALWTSWVHRGICVANGECRVCILNAKEFASIVCQFDHSDFDPCRYAGAYVHDLNAFRSLATDITSLKELAGNLGQKSEVAHGAWRNSTNGPTQQSVQRTSGGTSPFRFSVFSTSVRSSLPSSQVRPF